MIDDTVDCRRRAHGVGEDVLPLGEDQVRGYAQQPTFVAFGDEGEEHLGPEPGYSSLTRPTSGPRPNCGASGCSRENRPWWTQPARSMTRSPATTRRCVWRPARWSGWKWKATAIFSTRAGYVKCQRHPVTGRGTTGRARVYRHDLRCPHCGSTIRQAQEDPKGPPFPGQADLPLPRMPASLHSGRQPPLLPRSRQTPGFGHVRRGHRHHRHRAGAGSAAGHGLFLGQKSPPSLLMVYDSVSG